MQKQVLLLINSRIHNDLAELNLRTAVRTGSFLARPIVTGYYCVFLLNVQYTVVKAQRVDSRVAGTALTLVLFC